MIFFSKLKCFLSIGSLSFLTCFKPPINKRKQNRKENRLAKQINKKMPHTHTVLQLTVLYLSHADAAAKSL